MTYRPVFRDLLKVRLLSDDDRGRRGSAQHFAGMVAEMFYPPTVDPKLYRGEGATKTPDPIHERYALGFWEDYCFSKDQSKDAQKLREAFIFRRELELGQSLKTYFGMARHSREAHKWTLDAAWDKLVYVGGTDKEGPAPATYDQSLDALRTLYAQRSVRQVLEAAAEEGKQLIHLGGIFRVLYEMTKCSSNTEHSKRKACWFYSTVIVPKAGLRGAISTQRLQSLWRSYGDVAHCWAALSVLMDHPDPVTIDTVLDFVDNCDVERFLRISATFADFGLQFRQKRRGESTLIRLLRGVRTEDIEGTHRESGVKCIVRETEWDALEKYKPLGADSDLA